MEIIKRQRTRENYIIRHIPKRLRDSDIDTNASDYYYGKIPDFKINNDWKLILDDNNQPIKNTIDLDIFLTQDFDDMGIFTNIDFNPLTPYLTTPPTTYPPPGGVPPFVPMGPFNSFVYGRLPGAPIDFFIPGTLPISGSTDDSNLEAVTSYRSISPYNILLNLAEDITITFDGVTPATNVNSVTYAIGANPTNNTTIMNTGVHYITFKNIYVDSTDESGNPIRYKKTNFSSQMPGITNNNAILKALTKHEEYSGVVFKPEVESEVFIDRGIEDIFERHAMLSEIKSTSDIDDNKEGFLST